MGVAGLWDLIRPAAVRTSLHALGRDAFLANRNGLRAFTIGVDASIWIFHAQTTHAGSNPFLRTIFYRIAALLQHPVLPVFVFDGPKKPNLKRNRNIGGRFGVNDHYSTQFKQLLDVCGLEWWNAPGEAEAELALMNRQGKIDAVLSDDVDALLFGATCLLRNNSPTLSGAQASAMPNSSARSELRHYEMYKISDIVAEWTKEESALKNEEDCRMAMVLTALLSGGDYVPEGVCRMAMALAKAGWADFLRLYATSRPAFDRKVADVHGRIVEELKTNSSKHLGRRYKKSAEDIAKLAPGEVFQTFPLDSYLCPATSPTDDTSQGWPGFGKGEPSSGRGKARNTGRGDLEGMARACERYFEWGTREIVCKKFASDSVNLFGAEIVAEARHRARPALADTAPTRPTLRAGESPERITSYFNQSATRRITTKAGTSTTHLVKIHSTRHSPLCPTLQKDRSQQDQSSLLEYRLEYRTETYVARCRAAMDGTRADPSTLSAQERANLGMVAPTAPSTDTAVKDEIRIWIPEYLVKAAWPELVAAYNEEQAAKEAKKAAPKANGKKPAPKKKTPSQTSGENADAFRGYFTNPPASQSAVREAERVSTMTVSASQPLPSPTSSAAFSDLSPAPTPDPQSPDFVAISPSSPAPTLPATPSKRSRPRRGHDSSSSVSSESATEVVPTLPRHRSPRKRTTPERQPTAASLTGSSVDDAICISSDDDTPRPLRLSFATNKEPTPTPTRAAAAKQGRRPPRAAVTTKTTATTVLTSQASVAGSRPDPPRTREIVTPAPPAPPAMPTPPPTRQRDARRRPASATPTPHEPAAAAQQRERTPTHPAVAPRVTTSQSAQTRLDSMIVARPRKATVAAKPIPMPDSLPKPRTPYYEVSEDEDGVEHVDLTKSRPLKNKAALAA